MTAALRGSYKAQASTIAGVSVVAGDLIVVCWSTANSPGAGTVLNDDAGNVYVQKIPTNYAYTSVLQRVFVAKAATTASLTLTLTNNDGTGAPCLLVAVVSGNWKEPAAVIDQYAIGAADASAANTHTSPTLVNTIGATYCLSFWSQQYQGTTFAENGTGFTEQQEQAAVAYSALYDKAITGNGNISHSVTTASVTQAANTILTLQEWPNTGGGATTWGYKNCCRDARITNQTAVKTAGVEVASVVNRMLFGGSAAALDASLVAGATLTPTLTTGIPLAASLGGTATMGADLTAPGGVGAVLTANLQAQATQTAAISTGIKLTASPVAQATQGAALSTGIPLTASMAASATQTAAITTGIRLTSAPAAAATITAAVTTGIKLAAAPAATATQTAALSTGIALQAAPAAVATQTAALTTGIRLAAAPAAVASMAADLTVVGQGAALTANLQASASTGANLTTGILLTAPLQAQASASANLTTVIRLATTMAAQATAAAVLLTSIQLGANLQASAALDAQALGSISPYLPRRANLPSRSLLLHQRARTVLIHLPARRVLVVLHPRTLRVVPQPDTGGRMIQFSPEMPLKPGEGSFLSMDFARPGWLRPGETIDTCVWSCQVESGVDPNPELSLSGVATIDGTVVEQFVVGRTEGVVYLFLATVTVLPPRPAPMVGRALLRVATV